MTDIEPMTDERVAEIQARVKNSWAIQAVGPANLGGLEPWQLQTIAVAYVDDVADLLAEVDRLRAEAVKDDAELLKVTDAYIDMELEAKRLQTANDELSREYARFHQEASDETRYLRQRNDALEATIAAMRAEVERLRAAVQHAEQQARIAIKMMSLAVDAKKQTESENAAMRPIVAAVATPRPKNVCGLCTYPYASAHGKERQHTPDCPVVAAQAYVVAHPATGEGE